MSTTKAEPVEGHLDIGSSGPFDENRRKARYEMAYLEALCAQAGHDLSD